MRRIPNRNRVLQEFGPGSIRWSRALPTGSWQVTADGDYRINQTPPPTHASTNEFMPAMFGAGTTSTYVLSLADHLLAFDARTGAIAWSMPSSRLPADALITGVRVVDGMLWVEVTQEFATAAWRYDAVLVDLKSGRIQADIAGYQAGLVMATTTRAIVENSDVLQGVDRSTGRIVWTRPLGKTRQRSVVEVDGRVVVSLPPMTGRARSLVVLDPRDGKTVATMTAPHDVSIVVNRGTVLYLAGGGREVQATTPPSRRRSGGCDGAGARQPDHVDRSGQRRRLRDRFPPEIALHRDLAGPDRIQPGVVPRSTSCRAGCVLAPPCSVRPCRRRRREPGAAQPADRRPGNPGRYPSLPSSTSELTTPPACPWDPDPPTSLAFRVRHRSWQGPRSRPPAQPPRAALSAHPRNRCACSPTSSS